LTFTLGISIFWVIRQVKATFVDRFLTVNDSDVSPVTLVRLNSDEDANEIYRLLVHRKFIFNDEIKLIVLDAETTSCLYEDESVKEKFGVTDNYLLSNKTHHELKVSNLGINYVIVRNSDLPNDRFDNFWERFYKKYPNSPGHWMSFVDIVGRDVRRLVSVQWAGAGPAKRQEPVVFLLVVATKKTRRQCSCR